MHESGSPEDWTSTAAALRRAREACGMSLDDLAAKTRVSLYHLTAIEEAEFNRFGAPIYAIGSARSVARVLGVEEQPIVDSIKAGIAALTPVVAVTPEKRSLGVALGISAMAALGLSLVTWMIPGLRP